MFGHNLILIVEDEPLVAMSLAAEIEELDGVVVGPTPSVAEALAILEHKQVAGAILDANLIDRDVTPVALLLRERQVPFVMYSGAGVPRELMEAWPAAPLVSKPAPQGEVIAHLIATMARA